MFLSVKSKVMESVDRHHRLRHVARSLFYSAHQLRCLSIVYPTLQFKENTILGLAVVFSNAQSEMNVSQLMTMRYI